MRAAKCGCNLSRLTISGEEFSTSFADAHLQKLICLAILAGAPKRMKSISFINELSSRRARSSLDRDSKYYEAATKALGAPSSSDSHDFRLDSRH